MEDSGIDSGDKLNCIFNSTDSSGTKIVLEQSDDNSSNENVEVIYRNPNIDKSDNECNSKLTNVNTCKILQRKLELKVERAKRNYSQLHEEKDIKKKSSSLIPINRLKIPGCIEEQPLVEYKSDDISDDDDISFFLAKAKIKKQDLSDTFSIQEITIESDTDDSSQNLELLPPTNRDDTNIFLSCLSCNQKCAVM